MPQMRKSFLKNLKPSLPTGIWRVSIFAWTVTPGSPASGAVVASVETDDHALAVLAAHRLLDQHAALGPLITVEIAAAAVLEEGSV